MKNEKIIIDVQFNSKNGKNSVKLRALRNGSLLIDKARHESDDLSELFQTSYKFIQDFKGDDIKLKRGVTEDLFAKYLKHAEEEFDKKVKEGVIDELEEVTQAVTEEIKEVEGVLVDSIQDEEDKALLADLSHYKNTLLDAVRYADYSTALYQGILYNDARRELQESSGEAVNPFELTISLPMDEKEVVLEEVEKVNDQLIESDSETFEVKKYKRRLEITQTDYKLSIDFK